MHTVEGGERREPPRRWQQEDEDGGGGGGGHGETLATRSRPDGSGLEHSPLHSPLHSPPPPRRTSGRALEKEEKLLSSYRKRREGDNHRKGAVHQGESLAVNLSKEILSSSVVLASRGCLGRSLLLDDDDDDDDAIVAVAEIRTFSNDDKLSINHKEENKRVGRACR
uniref:Uncharacterized protein n=1 Tax=Vespula pensylvanica TaxID=30213 RepID=A0A834NXF0_VESPE|nr:hypothetical protein H0235_010511 [Vespula pensylvanica]